MANRAAGKGYENEDYYTNIKLQFIGIENIHVMRNSQQKIIDGKSWRVCVCVCVWFLTQMSNYRFPLKSVHLLEFNLLHCDYQVNAHSPSLW